MQDFRRLSVWQKAHKLVLAVYKATQAFPRSEQYGLTAQVRRAVVSIPANIAEGTGRGGDADFGRFVQMAIGSTSELEYHLLLARDLDMLPSDAHDALAEATDVVRRMLISLLKKLKGRP